VTENQTKIRFWISIWIWILRQQILSFDFSQLSILNFESWFLFFVFLWGWSTDAVGKYVFYLYFMWNGFVSRKNIETIFGVQFDVSIFNFGNFAFLSSVQRIFHKETDWAKSNSPKNRIEIETRKRFLITLFFRTVRRKSKRFNISFVERIFRSKWHKKLHFLKEQFSIRPVTLK